MPTLEVEKPNKQMQPWAKALVILVFAAAVIGLGWWIWQWRLSVDKQEFDRALTNQRIAGLTQDYQGSVSGWEKYRNGLPPRKYQYEAALYEGGQLETQSKLKEALAIYKVAEKHRKGNGTAEYMGIARTSEQLGDFSTAIEYYQKSETLYASYNSGTSEQDWIHMHIIALKEKANASK